MMNNLRLRAQPGGDPEEKIEFLPETTRQLRPNGAYSLYCAVSVVMVLLAMFAWCNMLNNRLPQPVSMHDAKPGTFVAESAIHYLQQLTSIGPRVVGSYENEVRAVDFLKREISFTMQRAKKYHKITMDVQTPTGCYILAFRPFGFVNCYDKIQNVVARLSPAEEKSSSAILLNCHFDSVPTSPGASDDGLNCAVMLEVMRILALSDTPLKHNVIFLFNGAEENPLQGAHGFITQHRWASEVKAFINLEAAGAGGKEILFQSGPNKPWLLKMYADSVPHPHGTVLGEEIFQSGLVPSDTDFRVFRDFGNLSGLDFAHKSNGYYYHTIYDSMSYIPEGTFQHTGDNILALVKKIAFSNELSDPEKASDGRVVYTDFGGLFMIYYTEFTGTIINMITFILSVFMILYNVAFIGKGLTHRQLLKELMLSAIVPIGGWILSAGFVLSVAEYIDYYKKTMIWYAYQYIILTLYVWPVLGCCMLVPWLVNIAPAGYKSLLSSEQQAQLHVTCVQFIWTMIMAVTTLFQLRLSFLLMMFVLFPTIANIAVIISKNQRKMSVWLIALMGSLVIPIFLVLWYSVLVFELFIPITGRIGPDKNPEIIIAILALLMTILATSYLTPLIALVEDPAHLIGGLLLTHMCVLPIVVGSPAPYADTSVFPHTQRMYSFHTERIFYGQLGEEIHRDAGVWLVPLDRNGPETIKEFIPDSENSKLDCENMLLCGLPTFTVRLLQIREHTYWIPEEPPVIHNPTKLELLSHKSMGGSVRRLTFAAKGPDHMQLHLSPKPGAKLVGWSFCDDLTAGEPKWKGRPTYFIHYGRGLESPSWQFWLDLEVPSFSNKTIIDLALIGQYMTSNHDLSKDFKDFLNKFPRYVKPVAWTSSYKHWQF